MKKTAKIVAVLLALALALSFSIVALAATVTKEPGVTGDGSITVNLPANQGEVANNTYKIYKVFDASVDPDTGAITYHTDKTTMPAGFTKDAQGNVTYTGTGNGTDLSEADINAIKAYVNSNDLVATVTTTADDTDFTVDGLPYGYYYITTTTGTLVTINSTNPDVEVNDKNDVPPVTKKITASDGATTDVKQPNGEEAMAQVGTVVDFEATITKKAGAQNYVFHDTMSDGLTYNNDIVVSIDGTPVEAAGHFTVGAIGEDTITVTFYNNYINTLADDTVITFTYSATVNEDALVTDEENNTCYLSYGDENAENHTPEEEVKVYDATILVNKYYEDENDEAQPLAGAGFVLKNSQGKYYALDETDGTVIWVDSIDDALELFTGDDGKLENGGKFTGLASGTYTLEEKTVPAGYNKAEDASITITANDYTEANLVQTANVEDEAGTTLPSTGGIGTTIFYIVGGLLVIVSAVVLIAKRRTKATVA